MSNEKVIRVFSDFGECLWPQGPDRWDDFYNRLPKALQDDLDAWNAAYWEDECDKKHQKHNLTRAQYNAIGRDLARRVKQALPEYKVIYNFLIAEYVEMNGKWETAQEIIE